MQEFQSWSIADYVLERTAGVLQDDLLRLQAICPPNVVEISELHAKEKDLTSQFCDSLYLSIKGQEDRGLRRNLLQIRRDVYNGRIERSLPLMHAISQDAPRGSEHLAALHVLHNIKTSIDATWAHCEEELRCQALRVAQGIAELWSREQSLRTALFVAQPQLAKELNILLSEDDSQLSLEDRAVCSLLSYIVRAATKPSPFSSLTHVKVELLSAKAPGIPHSAFSFHPALTDRVAAAVCSNSEIREHLSVRPSRAIWAEDGLIHVLHSANPWRQRIISLDLSRAVALAIRFAGEGNDCRTIVELRRALTKELSLSAEQSEALVDNLLSNGFIEHHLAYSSNDRRALNQLATGLPEVSSCSKVRSALLEIQSDVDGLSLRDASSVPGTINHIQQTYAAVLHDLGHIEPFDTGSLKTVYHDSFTTGPISVLDQLESIGNPLDDICAILPLFNADLDLMACVGDFVSRSHSAGLRRDLLSLFRAFCLQSNKSEVKAEMIDDPMHSLVRTPLSIEAERERWTLVSELYKLAACSAPEPVELESSFFRRWGRIAKRYAPCAPQSTAVMIQGRHDLHGSIVLNKVSAGYGRLFANYASDDPSDPATRQLCEILRRRLSLIDVDAEAVELIGTFGFDRQIHPRLTGRCFVVPGEPINEIAGHIVPWSECEAEVDSRGRPQLRSRNNGRRILPLHFGPLSSLHLPSFYRFLCAFGPCYSPDLPLLDYLAAADSRSSDIRRFRRITYGPVTLCRESWLVRTEIVPAKTKHVSPMEDFLRLRTWIRDVGMPSRTFVTAMRLTEFLSKTEPLGRHVRLCKPFFVNWDDFASYRLFRRFIDTKSTSVTFTEALPDPLDRREGARASEAVLEVDRI